MVAQLAFVFVPRAPVVAAPVMDYAAAWRFAAEHNRFILSISRRYSQDPETFAQDLRIYVVERFHRYDPTRSKPTTWIGFQALAVRKTHQRSAARSTARWDDLDDHDPSISEGAIEASLELGRLKPHRIALAISAGAV